MGSLLNLMVFVASNLCFLTQFMRSYDLLLVDVISWILLLLWTQDFRVDQKEKPCIGFIQENLMES